MASEVSHVLKEADTPQDTQFTINLYNCFGMITKTYHPKTVSEPVHIGSDESSDLIGFPTGSLTLRIGTENVIAEDGSTITYNIQPYCLEGCQILEPGTYKVSASSNTTQDRSEQYGSNSIDDKGLTYSISDVDIIDGKIIPRN